ncbi:MULTISPECIES: phospholipid scramblase-related protein [Thermomonosporaceae]|uniref:phospholipid scramblase-related protein n=1 Tax=Thermomonosporaceae TaxID=2012 RepID=UPI00255ABA37|nr:MULTISPECIES: phospholipid scramblase-related protein [Thermomonosporaceae]MDL4772708.1 phospholipid scramblase-related protein [Actinomadura xylanilytica]
MSEPFNSPVLRVEQPRRGPFAKSRYKVMDGDGTLLAVAAETGDHTRAERLQTLFPGKSDLHARAVLLTTPEGTPLMIVDKQTGRSLTEVRTPEDELVGTFRTERIGRHYLILGAKGNALGEVRVDLARNNFTVNDTAGEAVAHVRKKFAGVATHLLTTADKYAVQIADPVPEPLRTMAVMTAIVMDLSLHESKEIT